MKMDPTTESIAHFIGLFELAVEELRLRQDYLEFKFRQNSQEDAPPIEAVGVRLQVPYELGRYDPELAYRPVPPELAPVDHARTVVRDSPEVPSPTLRPPEDDDRSSLDRVEVTGSPVPLQPPGSVVSVTLQHVSLSDNDLFLNGLGADFTAPEVLEQALDAIVAVAETLVGFRVPDLPQDANWIGFAEQLLAQIGEAKPVPDGAEMSTFRGSEAEGTIVDGVAADEAPVWTDLLPLYLRPEESDDDSGDQELASFDGATDGETVVHSMDGIGGPGTAKALGEHDFSRDFADDASDEEGIEPGHEIVTGANEAINEIALGSQWIDAPVIVVRGDVAKFDAVSQVNVLVEHDTIDGVAAGQESAAYNVAEIIETSSEATGAPPPSDVLPSAWQVARLEADLLQVNWVKQFTYVTDFDRVEVTFAGQATFLGTGENDILNAAILNQFGYQFDAIFVSGDMVDVTVVSQKNVLFDSDAVTTREPAAAAEPPPTAAEPPADEAPALASDDPGPAQVAPAEEATGAAVPAPTPAAETAISDAAVEWSESVSTPGSAERSQETAKTAAAETNLARTTSTHEVSGGQERSAEEDEELHTTSGGDVDGEDDAAVAVPDARDGGEVEGAEVADPATSDAPPAMSLADNLLFNKVTIEKSGVDTFVEMTEAFAATAEELAEGAETIAREAAQDALFAGKDALTVLQIDGNLTKVNLFEQTNIVGDADQLRLEMDALRDRFDAEMKMIAGSNALVNLAQIYEHGVDSTVMAGGHVYDDAFIHQAELFDTDALPTGVAVTGLASEAIAAFLSDDMLKIAEATDAIVPTSSHESSSHLDVMQTALV